MKGFIALIISAAIYYFITAFVTYDFKWYPLLENLCAPERTIALLWTAFYAVIAYLIYRETK